MVYALYLNNAIKTCIYKKKEISPYNFSIFAFTGIS